MKDNLELVEKLVEKTGLSYTEAKAALEKADWDILDALINLETEGKVRSGANFSTRAQNEKSFEYSYEYTASGGGSGGAQKQKSERNEEYKKTTVGVLEWLRGVFDKGNHNNLELYNKEGNLIVALPVTVFVILLLISVGTVLALMVVSLFFGVRYRFSGPDLGKDKINNVMGKATDVADSIKKEVKSAGESKSE
ncbi:MAG: hypothetical protein LBM18_05025 [Oscillospiraceae bacterium]|jgi:hypothetical protein|nr:hypothetical protein [Oscillospiraceae bacterium]